MSSSSNNIFRLHGKHLFLTYPQCSITTVDAEAALRGKLKHYKWSVIAREKHADGHPHLHAFVCLGQPCNFTSPTCLDLLAPGGISCHGNYQVARDAKASLDYVCKDGDVECFGITLDAARASFSAAGRKRNATEVLMDEMQKGKTLIQAAEAHPEHLTFAVLHADRIEKWFTQKILQTLRPSKKFAHAMAVYGQSTAQDLSIANWLNSNLTNRSRPLATKQLWIAGPTCHGKTTLVILLNECFRIYWVPDEDFYDDYFDASYDLIVFDEFKHQKTVQWMNRFVDGQICPLRQKGKQTVKRLNLPVIVLSNFTMRQCYPNVEQGHFDTLARRFTEIWLDKPLSVTVTTVDTIADVNDPVVE